MRPRLLDLFCGAGGAGKGYSDAGFEVVGVDINPQPNYPFEFVQADALDPPVLWDEFHAVHASPPCQVFSRLGSRWPDRKHPDLLGPTREMLRAVGLPYVIENVDTAPMLDPLTLCGSMFGLSANGRQLRRHRLFECSFYVMRASCQHRGQALGVYGHGGGVGSRLKGYTGSRDEWATAMGMPWARKHEIAQAIPPAYTEHIGGYLLGAINAAPAAVR